MDDDARILELLETLLDSGGTPEEVCADCPELLPSVRQQWEQCQRLEARIDEVFPSAGSSVSGDAIAAPLEPVSLPRIPGYEVEAVLGRGGIGIVYKARQLGLNRTIALKMLLFGVYASRLERARFLREAQAVACLRHPAVVQVHDFGEVEGRPFLTMEFVEGKTLAEDLAGIPQPAGRAAAMLTTLADAIESAHRGGIIHRDLKPANILLSRDGDPKISDFGLARRFEGEDALTVTGARVGTPSYMAPEQVFGRAGTVGPAADIYALGAILYEMLTGRPPFRGETASDTERQVLEQEPIPPSRLNAKIPRDLDTICLKCLQKDPSRRYATAGDVAADLHRFSSRNPIVARPVGATERAVKWARRRPAAAALGGTFVAAALLALALVGGWLRVSGQRMATLQAADQDLREADARQRHSDFSGARAALERARGRMGAIASPDLQRHVGQAGRNLVIVARLDRIRMTRSASVGGVLGTMRSDAEYEAAFRDAGLGQINESPSIVAARVSESSIEDALVAALDDWSMCTEDAHRQSWLIEVARLADRNPTSWRVRARDPATWETKAVRDAFIASTRFADESVPLLLASAHHLQHAGADPIPFLTRAQEAHPGDFWVNLALGDTLTSMNATGEAVRFFQAAVAIRPDAAIAYNDLGVALAETGRVKEGVRCYRQAISLDPTSSAAQYNLAVALTPLALTGQTPPDEAIGQIRRALGFYPNSATLFALLGDNLEVTGRRPEAVAAYRQAIDIEPNLPGAQKGLRTILVRQGRLDEARVAWRKTVDANPPQHEAWDGYAELCLFLGEEIEYRRASRALLDRFGAITDPRPAERTGRAALLLPAPSVELRDAVALIDRALASDPAQPHGLVYPYFRFSKGLAEYRLGELDSAIAIMKGDASGVLGPAPKLVLAMAQHRQGRTQEARKTLAAAVLSFDWHADNANNREAWIYHVLRREAETLILPNVPAFLERRYQPTDNDERIALLGVCQFKDLRGAEASLYAAAFAADAKLADDWQRGCRYSAARAAAMAGCGGGADAAKLSDEDRAWWRRQAREWLRADLAAWTKGLKTGSAVNRAAIVQKLAAWQTDPDLAGLRDPGALDKLPGPEREECRELWNDLGVRLARESAQH